MTHPMNSEEAFKKFESLVKSYSDTEASIYSSNEASTRLLLIDEILILLGWDKSSFNPETHIPKAGFSDYLLTIDGNPRLVVEAKKIGDTFRSTKTKLLKREYEVRYLKRAFKSSFSDVIEQASNYCVETKVPFALLTNGAEWIVIQLLTLPGVSLDTAKGIYFGNIFSERFEFDLFWNLISKNAFNDCLLEEYLSNINYQPSEVCRILRSDYSSLQWQSDKQEEYLSDFYEHFFSQITESNKRNMLEFCFVSDSKLDQYRGELKRLLKDSTPKFLPLNTDDFEPGEGKASILNDSNTGQVVIITGSVGCGKSTLVTKCLVEARQQKGELAKPILIDLINEVSRSNINARNIIFALIYKFLEEKFEYVFGQEYLRKIYSREVRQLKEGEYKDYFIAAPQEFIKQEADLISGKKQNIEDFVLRALKQLTSENNSVILIIDNVDRAHEKFQEEMYALSHKISSFTGAKTIITLREFTFFKNKTGGFLDVRSDDKVIHLKAPDFEKLISKRIKYIDTKLDDDYRKKEWRRRYEDYDDFIKGIKLHASAVKNSIQISSDGHNILETLSSISWHNIRYFYELLKRVHRQLGSSCIWNSNEVIAALMSSTEIGEKPTLPNLFIPYQNMNQAYFLKLRLITFLSILKAGEITSGVPVNRIIDFLKLYGYQRVWITASIIDCVKQRLIECLEIPSEEESINNFELDLDGTYRLSPLGLLYLNQIIKNRTYQSLISVDLPFHSLLDFDSIKVEFEDVISYMTDQKQSLVFKEGLDIIVNSELSSKTGEYLSKELIKEQTLTEGFLSHTELQLTERKVQELFMSINELNYSFSQPVTTHQSKPQDDINISGQQCLEFDTENNENIEAKEIQGSEVEHRDFVHSMEYEFDDCNHLGTEYIPLIFCALRLRFMEGIEYSSGVELTKLINDYLVSDTNQKFPNNVSRALRSNKLQSQKWLECRTDMHVKNKMFGLTDCWETYWSEIFEKEEIE
jgi:hypothetical protein